MKSREEFPFFSTLVRFWGGGEESVAVRTKTGYIVALRQYHLAKVGSGFNLKIRVKVRNKVGKDSTHRQPSLPSSGRAISQLVHKSCHSPKKPLARSSRPWQSNDPASANSFLWCFVFFSGITAYHTQLEKCSTGRSWLSQAQKGRKEVTPVGISAQGDLR